MAQKCANMTMHLPAIHNREQRNAERCSLVIWPAGKVSSGSEQDVQETGDSFPFEYTHDRLIGKT